MMKLWLVLVSISTYCYIGAEGFVAGTYVKVPHGYETIDNLKSDDKIISYDFNQNAAVERSIIEIHKQHVDQYIRLVAYDSIIEVSPEQKFYLHALKKWETIDTIKNSPELLHILYIESHIAYLGDIDQGCDVYMLTLDEPHNFFITSHDILVHNFLAITLFFAFGEGTIDFLLAESLAAIGGSLIGWAGYNLFSKPSRRYRANDRAIRCDLDQIKNSPRPNEPDDEEFQITRRKINRKARHRRFGNIFRDTQTGEWWSKDLANHGESCWKVFREGSRGLEWIYDADRFGKIMLEKHKGPIGRFIPWSELIMLS